MIIKHKKIRDIYMDISIFLYMQAYVELLLTVLRLYSC